MDLGIAGENALVLGGSKGLGFACALELSRAGVRVAINGRDAEGGATALKQLGEGAIFVKGDVAEPGRSAGSAWACSPISRYSASLATPVGAALA